MAYVKRIIVDNDVFVKKNILLFLLFFIEHFSDYHYNIFGLSEAKKRGVKALYTMHNTYTWKSDEEIRSYSSVLNEMDAVVPVSNLVKNYYLSRTDARKDTLQVIYNGIDFDELSNTELPDYPMRRGRSSQI